MTTILVWILLSNAGAGGYAPNTVISRFATKADCESARAAMERATKDASTRTAYGACFEARVLVP